MNGLRLHFGLALAVLLLAGCGGQAASNGRAPGGTEGPGLSSIAEFAWVSKSLARGGQPKGEEAFRALGEGGFKTIISVDGARPNVEQAATHGMRYVHIPFGYEGVSRERQLELAKTVRELDGPFYVHCHHGKHRGPAAAVLAQMTLGGMSNEQAVGELTRAGTAAKYTGLYSTAETYRAPSEEETRALGFEFPAVAPVPEFAAGMADVDRKFDNLKLVRKSGWRATAEHPDVDPPHEALQVMELLTEIARLDDEADRPSRFRELMAQSVTASRDLEAALRASPANTESAEAAFKSLRQSCGQCHSSYRNTRGR